MEKKKYHDMSEEKKQKLKEYRKNMERQKNLNKTMNKIVFYNSFDCDLIVYVLFI